MNVNFPVTRLSLDNSATISVNGRELPAIAYMSYFPESNYYKEMIERGVRLFCFPAYLAGRGINIHSGIGPFREGIWKDEFAIDFSDIVADFEKISAVTDDAAVIMRLHLDVPEWWEEKYHDQCCILDNGKTLRQSFSSTKWISDVNRLLKEIITWCNDGPYARYLAGIHVAAGGTEEWFYHFFGSHFEDNCEERIIAFRKWMSEAYGHVNSDIVPADINPGGKFDSHKRDTMRFHMSQISERICEFCETVKRESHGHLLTGAFYGYHNLCFSSLNGHNALGKLLQCPHLDYLASPNVYDRQPGRDWPPMAAVDSVKLHGKLWMAENDTRTFCTKPLKEKFPLICPEGAYVGGVWEGPKSKRVSRMLIRNNAARMLTHQYGGWWFDMWGGWFSDPELLCEIELCQQLAGIKVENPLDYPNPEICVVVDEEIILYDESFGEQACQIISQYHGLAANGYPYCMYLRSDLDKINYSRFKFVWLLGCHELDFKELEVLKHAHEIKCGLLHTDFEKIRFLAPSANLWQYVCSPEKWSPEKLNQLCKQSMVHKYVQSKDIIYVGAGFLAIHACSGGRKEIYLPGKYTVKNVVTDETLCMQQDSFSLEMRKYDTLLLMLR